MKEENIFDDIVCYEQKCLCVFVIDTFSLKTIDEVTLGIQRILSEFESDEAFRERVEVSFITYESLSDEIRIVQEPVPISQADIPSLVVTTDDTSLTRALYMAMDVVEKQVTWYKNVGIPYYLPCIFLISNGMSLFSCNIDEIANRIKQDTSNKKYVFLPIYTEDAEVPLLQEIESDVPITALDSLNITDCFKWLSSSMGEVCSSNSVSLTENCDWMEVFTIGESCGSSETCSESSGSVGSYDIDNDSNIDDWDVDFQGSHSCSVEKSSESSSSVDRNHGCYDIGSDGNIDDWNVDSDSCTGLDSSNDGIDYLSFDWFDDYSDNNNSTIDESRPRQLSENKIIDVRSYNVTGGIDKSEYLSVDKIAQCYGVSVEEASEWLYRCSHGRAIENEVYSSVFAPAEVKRKSHMLVQVYLHLYEETEKVKSLAQESDKNAERRDYIPLQCKLKKGDKVDVQLNIYGESLLMSDKKRVVWQGSFTKCSFDYFVPKDIDVDELSCVAMLTVNEVPVGEMRFITRVVDAPRQLNSEIIAHKYNKVFISYSHQDESKVKFLHEGLELGSVPHFFDRKYLKAGDVFPQVIQDYINNADLFILCWSENASKSEYVQKERLQALERAFPQVKPEQEAKLRIYPMSIEPRAELPGDMKENYHFGEI